MNLHSLRDRRDRIESLKERIERLRSAMELGDRQLKIVPTRTAIRNRLEEDMAKLDELERELVGEVAAFEQEARSIEQLLEGLPVREQRIMRLRYVEGLSWRKVARKAHYSVSYCKNVHAVVIKNL